MFSKFIWVTLIQKQQIYKNRTNKRDFEFWAWAPHFIMIWNITVRNKFWRTYLFQDGLHASTVSLLCKKKKKKKKKKKTWKQCCIERCVVVSLKFELNKSIIKQLIKHLFHTFLMLFRFKSKCGCPISSKITKLYFISNIIQLPRG